MGCGSNTSANTAEGLVIIMPRGDIRPVRFFIRNRNTKDIISNFDEIYFTVKRSFDTKDYLFQKRYSENEIELQEDGSYQLVIDAKDTEGRRYGTYVFDIEILRGSDVKQTYTGKLVLTDEATHYNNE